MLTLLGQCPNCGHENEFFFPTNAEQLAEFERDLEADPKDSTLLHIVNEFKKRKQSELCLESKQNRRDCENCGEDYAIQEADNWEDVQTQLDAQ